VNTQHFLSELQQMPDKALVFDYGEGRVKPGYHVTEIKAASVQTMDCGGQGNAWSETTLQVWSPDNAEAEGYMSVSKFLNIYERVASSIPIVSSAELRVEYGDVGTPAISYLIQGIEVAEDTVVVRLSAPTVACKGANRSVGDIPVLEPLTVLNTNDQACCTPSTDERACCA